MTFDDVEKMTLVDARSTLGQAVYRACYLLEQLENAGKLSGNGHHAAQTIAQYAEKLLTKQWIMTRLS